MGRVSRCMIVTVFLSTAVIGGGCASSSGVKRPAPFPGIPAPPPTVEPEPLIRSWSTAIAEVLHAAYDLQGIRYHLGGESPLDGFDCSGFVRYVFGLNHLLLPRTVQEQYGFGSDVDVDKVKEGDLVFFSTVAPGPSHVGIAVGPGIFIHAPGSNGAVRVERFDTPYWHERIVGVKRVL